MGKRKRIDSDYELNISIRFWCGDKEKSRKQFVAYRDALYTLLAMPSSTDVVITSDEKH